jgi:uncharacterized protein
MKLDKLLALSVLMSINLLYSASFDCGKASSKVEHLICGDHELSILDEHLFIAYRNAKKYEDPKRLASEQREWLRRRNLCATIECLQKSYVARLKTLEDYAKGVQPKPWSGTFELEHGDNKLVIKPSMVFAYSNVGARGVACDIKGKFAKVADKLEFHDDVNDCHLKVTVVTHNMLHLEATPCQVNYCGIHSRAQSGTYKRTAK